LKNFFLKVSQIALGITIAFVLLFAVLGYFLTRQTSFVLNTKSIRWITRQVEMRAGVRLDFPAIRISARPSGALRSHITLDLERPCVRAPEFSSCFAQAHFEFEFGFSKLKFQLIEVGPVRLTGGNLRATFPEEARPSEDEAPPSGNAAGRRGTHEPASIRLPPWASKAPVNDLQVQLSSFEVTRGRTSYTGALILNASASPALSEIHAQIIDAKVALKESPISPFNDVIVHHCRIALKLEGGGSRLALNCPVELPLRATTTKRLPKFLADPRIVFRIESNLWNDGLLETSRHVSGVLKLDIPRFANTTLAGFGSVLIRVEGIPSQADGGEFNAEADLDLRFEVLSFRQLRLILARTAWAIPAPFNVLNGKAELSARGSVDLNGGTIPIQLVTDLRSPEENFETRSNGTFSFSRKEDEFRSHLKMDIALSRVRLVLPRIELTSIPPLTPDARIRRPVQAAEAEPSFVYEIRITTPAGPVLLDSNLAEIAIPVRLDLTVRSDKPVSGAVQVEELPLQLFRRSARVDYLNLGFKADRQSLNGSIRLIYADYTVRIELLGTIDEPVFRLSSDPPLPHGEVLSVLLYGKPSEGLDSGELQSVTSVEAALQERAITLASFYLLASTPIESVGYNPEAGEFSIKVRLGEGTSFNLTVPEKGRLSPGLRKRLGRSWSITTQIFDPLDPSRQTLSAFLEWRHRY